MSTTAAILELLVIGVQALVWMGLLVCSIFGFGWASESWFVAYKDYATVLGIAVLCFAYPLGVAVDEFADEVVFRRPYLRMRHRITGKPSIFLLLMDPKAAGARWYFDYTRTKIRLVRSSCVNCWLIAICGALLVHRQQLGGNGWIGVIWATAVGLAFFASWFPIQRHQLEKAKEARFKVEAIVLL
jgi:hypothetical protein